MNLQGINIGAWLSDPFVKWTVIGVGVLVLALIIFSGNKLNRK